LEDATDIDVTVFGGTSRDNLTIPLGTNFRSG